MKNRGFTLIELLAMLVVLGILIGITIPNMSGILGNQRENAYRQDASNLVERVKVKVAKDSKIVDPDVGKCVVFTLNYLNDNDDYEKGPNNGIYEEFDSFVVYKKVKSSTGSVKYQYYVRLLEKVGNDYFGYDLKDIDEIPKLESSKITSFYHLTKTESSSLAILQANKPSMCTDVVKYYVHRKI